MPFQPFPTDLGRQILDQVCNPCWQEWVTRQRQLINHYALDLRDPKARGFLLEEMKTFLLP